MDLPLPVTLSRCGFCRIGKVADILFTTIDIPEDLPITGKSNHLKQQSYIGKSTLACVDKLNFNSNIALSCTLDEAENAKSIPN